MAIGHHATPNLVISSISLVGSLSLRFAPPSGGFRACAKRPGAPCLIQVKFHQFSCGAQQSHAPNLQLLLTRLNCAFALALAAIGPARPGALAPSTLRV